jgi:hypothetical protein
MMSSDSQAHYDAVVAEMVATAPVLSGKMFGMPCLKMRESGKAFAGFFNGAMVFKLGGSKHAEALALDGARLFDPMQGRPMKAWVEVPVEHAARWLEFARAAFAFLDEA